MSTKQKKVSKAKKTDATPSVIATVAADMKIKPSAARRKLRAAGLKAPYTDAAAIRKALTVKE